MSNQPPNKFIMTRLPWIIAALAVIALVATLLWQRGSGSASAAGGNAELEALQARLVALETGQAPGIAGGLGGTRARGGAGRPSPMAPGGVLEALSQRTRTPEQQAADRQRELAVLEAQFARDAADPVKGGQVERSLEQTVTGETMTSTGMKPDDVAIDCKRNGCRIVADFAKPGDAQDWAVFYLTASAQNLSSARMVQIPQPDGSSEVRIYGVRK